MPWVPGCCASRKRPDVAETPLVPGTGKKSSKESPVGEAARESGVTEGEGLLEEVSNEVRRVLGEGQAALFEGAGRPLLERIDVEALAGAVVHGDTLDAVSAYKRGELYMRDNMYLAYLDQATISISGAERFFPSVMEVCNGLVSGGVGQYITSHLILEPPPEEGRDAGFVGGRPGPMPGPGEKLMGEGDVLVVQLMGSRRLTVIRGLRGLPVTAPRPKPQLEATLQAGDAVFIPSGLEVRTERVANKGPQLYLVIVLRSKEQDPELSMMKYLTDLMMDPNMSKESDAFFRSAATRRSWPAMGLDPKRKPGSIPEDVQEKAADEDKENKTPLAKLASKSVDEFARMISAKGLKEHYQRRMAELREKQRTAAMEVAITIGRGEGPKEAVWPSSSVRIAAGVKVSCQDGSSVAAFKRGEDTLNLPIAPTASFLISDLSTASPMSLSR
eukprot:CAMPEP_0206495582 /NCGR_PEP_ID=MMETSP0324_2-20121206/48691_1 /ASSEMBLY_ACC=CAM_ASM_000836 /TAXON_ID=2866 /ORGANISM="Crypthecodinium cohnii, Strain Seligo" /LENGTH=444 /DNA_ID=CAMNT_0053980019 /DNA_START=147 /DNA_END=1482 /DNA_ORIENTATION=+